jgi:4'-phosphopantetheinyl transferase
LRAIKALRADQTVILFRNLAYAPCGPSDYGTLSTAEQERYSSYMSQTSAQLFLAGRVLIKQLFSKWLGCSPGEVSTSTQQHEKPRLILNDSGSTSRLPFFSLSHSSNWVVLAVSARRPIGVDIEVDTQVNADCLYSLNQLYTPLEISFVQQPALYAARLARFLDLWRGKEAIMKATGKGFQLLPNSFEILQPSGIFKDTVCAEGSMWHLMQTQLRPQLRCAIAQQAT